MAYGSELFDQPASLATPYPQGVGFGLGQAANAFARNLISSMLWRQKEERRKRQEALDAISAVARLGGGEVLRNLPQEYFTRAGLPPMSALPPSLEQMKSEALRQLWPSLSEDERLGAIFPELYKAKERARRETELRSKLFQPEPGPLIEPPATPSGTAMSLPAPPPTRQRLRRTLKETPEGVELTTSEETATAEDLKREQLINDRRLVEPWVEQNIKLGRIDIHKEANDLGVKPSDVREAIITDILRSRFGHNIPSEIKGYAQLREEALRRRAEERKFEEDVRRQKESEERMRIAEERLKLAQDQAVQMAKRTELMTKQFNALLERGQEERAMVRYQELRRTLEDQLQSARKQLDQVVELVKNDPATLADPNKAFQHPQYKFWLERIAELESEIRGLAGRVEAAPGPGGRGIVRPKGFGGSAESTKERFPGWIK